MVLSAIYLNGLLFAGAIPNACQMSCYTTLQFVNPFHQYQLFYLHQNHLFIHGKTEAWEDRDWLSWQSWDINSYGSVSSSSVLVPFPRHPRLSGASSMSFTTCAEYVLNAQESWTGLCCILSDFALTLCGAFCYAWYKFIFTIATWYWDLCSYCWWENWFQRG